MDTIHPANNGTIASQGERYSKLEAGPVAWQNDPRLRQQFGLPTSLSRNDRLSRLPMIVAGYNVCISKAQLPDWTVDISTHSDRVQR
jgi:hypothetical protein